MVALILGMMMALPVAQYPAAAFDGNEQTQPVLPEGGTDVANASDYNKATTETKAHGDDLRGANVAGGQPNHTGVHTDQEARIAALEAAGGGPGFVEVIATHTTAEGSPKTLVTIPINALTGVLLSVFAAGYDTAQDGGIALIQHQAFHRIVSLQKNTGVTALSDDSAGTGAQLNLVVSGNNILIQSVIISDITWKINYLLITAP